MDTQIYELLKNMDKKIDDLQKELSELKVGKNKKENVIDENWWSIEDYDNNVLIRFSRGKDFDDFKKYIKELGGTWNFLNKAWKFPKISSDQIITKISEKFTNKDFRDLRN